MTHDSLTHLTHKNFTLQQEKLLTGQLLQPLVRKDNIAHEANLQEFPIRKVHLIIDNSDSVQNRPIRAYR